MLQKQILVNKQVANKAGESNTAKAEILRVKMAEMLVIQQLLYLLLTIILSIFTLIFMNR